MFRKGDREYQFQKRNFELIAYLNSKTALDEKILNFFIENERDFYRAIKENTELRNNLCKDEKTGLLTYKDTHLRDTLQNYYNNSQQLDTVNVSLIRFDLDNFSGINTSFGHKFGDEVLNKFAEILIRNSRPGDLLIRYGGEEFDVIIINDEGTGAENFTKRVINITGNTLLRYNRTPVRITVSAGISSRNIKISNFINNSGSVDSLNEVLQVQADHALYESKFTGKNRLSIFSEDKLNYYTEIRNSYKRSFSVVNE
ncbi:MAG: GGDEF domain-containing protein [Spirochaetes bacterium]|nr:GGDEF domain-containing protein [Spirochaetota bacterium]